METHICLSNCFRLPERGGCLENRVSVRESSGIHGKLHGCEKKLVKSLCHGFTVHVNEPVLKAPVLTRRLSSSCRSSALEGSRKQFCAICLILVLHHQPKPCLLPSPPVTTVSLVESSRIATGAVLLLVSRALFILISIYYYYQVGRRPKKV